MCLMLLTCNVAGFVFPTPSSIGEPCGEEYGVAVKYFAAKRKPKAKLVLLSSFFILFLLQLQDVALDFKELVW